MKKALSEYSDVISINELMEILGIGRNTAYRLINEGAIKTLKIGKRYIIPKQSVIVYLASANL